MPYVRTHGNQVSIVHGRRNPDTKQVEQEILMSLYSVQEAREALGKNGPEGAHHFRSLLINSHPELRFDWKRLAGEIEARLGVLPEVAPSQSDRVLSSLQEDMHRFARRLALTEPRRLTAARALQECREQLQVLSEWIEHRLEAAERAPSEEQRPRRFQWEVALQPHEVPSDLEELAADHYERGDDDHAERIFSYLVSLFPRYAEGWNYLGLISLRRADYEEAIARFTRTTELGRVALPKRVAKERWWSAHDTRPFMRGLRNLAIAFQRAGQYRDAIAVATRLERECHDDLHARSFLAAAHLCLEEWRAAYDAAVSVREVFPSESLVVAFAAHAMGDRLAAADGFLHAMLNGPRTVGMVLGVRYARPTTYDDISEHNAGVATLQNLEAYLLHSSLASRRFFMDLWTITQAHRDELTEARTAWEGRNADRRHFDRMRHMQSFEYARELAHQLVGMDGTILGADASAQPARRRTKRGQ